MRCQRASGVRNDFGTPSACPRGVLPRPPLARCSTHPSPWLLDVIAGSPHPPWRWTPRAARKEGRRYGSGALSGERLGSVQTVCTAGEEPARPRRFPARGGHRPTPHRLLLGQWKLGRPGPAPGDSQRGGRRREPLRPAPATGGDDSGGRPDDKDRVRHADDVRLYGPGGRGEGRGGGVHTVCTKGGWR